jgi:phage terminase large subunit-like protein
VLRRRLEYPALKRAVREQQNLFDANVVLIEDKASGTQLIQELVMDGCHAVTSYTPDCDKIMRLYAQTSLIENGFSLCTAIRALAGRVLARDDSIPEGQARRPGRLDCPVSRLV